MKHIDHVVGYMRFKIEYEGLDIQLDEHDECHIIKRFKEGQRYWGGIRQPVAELLFDDEGLPIADYHYGYDWPNKEWLVLSPIRLYWNRHNLHKITDNKYIGKVEIMPLLDIHLVNLGKKDAVW